MKTFKELAFIAGTTEIAELRGLEYKTDSVLRLLQDPELEQSNQFMMHLLGLMLEEARAFNSIMKAHNGDPSGVEYKQPSHDKYAFVLPDASQSGRWRVSYFDKHGFSYHEVAPTMPMATQLMVKGGFTEAAIGSLDCLATTKAWALGVELSDLLMQLNMGKITYVRYSGLQAELNALYQDAPGYFTASAMNAASFPDLIAA